MSINLKKGNSFNLSKNEPGLKKLMLGLGWDVVSQRIDLDASVFMIGANGKLISDSYFVFYNNLTSPDGAIKHTGDNRTGAGEGDDEQIIVDLSRIPVNVKSLMFVVNSFLGQNFSQIENAFCRIVNQKTGQEIAKYNLSCQGNHTAQIMAKVYRYNGEWKMNAIGENASGRTFQDLLPAMTAHL